MPKKHHVFLSYSRVDTEIMRRIKNSLRQAGLKIWTDEGIVPGTPSWKEAIEDAIRETEILVVLMSPDSNKSVWVQREIDYADVQDVQILSLLVRGEPRDAIPFALAGSQFIDVRSHYNDGVQRLISRCYDCLHQTGGVTVVNVEKNKKASPATRNRRKLPFYAGGGVGAILLILAGLFAMDILPIATPTATRTPTTVPTTEVALIASDTPERTPQPTDTVRPTIPSATPTRTPVPTDTPTRTSTPTDTLTPSPSPTPSGALHLRYNANSLVIYNRTNSTASILGLEFTLITQTGNESDQFASRSWGSAVTTLSAGQCVQVWRNDFSFLPANVSPANICRTRRAFTSTTNEFWIGDWEGAYFEVRRFGILLTTCPTIASSSSGVQSCFVDIAS